MWQFLIPAAIGALTNNGNPLKGAAIGAGLGAVGGAVLPSVGGLGGAQAGAEGAAGSGGLFGSLFSQPGDATTAGLSKPGLLSEWGDRLGGGLDEASRYAKPVGQLASTANGMQGLLSPQRHAPAAPMQMGGGQSVSQPIAGLLDAQRQLELQRRQRGLLG